MVTKLFHPQTLYENILPLKDMHPQKATTIQVKIDDESYAQGTTKPKSHP